MIQFPLSLPNFAAFRIFDLLLSTSTIENQFFPFTVCVSPSCIEMDLDLLKHLRIKVSPHVKTVIYYLSRRREYSLFGITLNRFSN